MGRHSSEVQLVDMVAYIILDVPDPHPAAAGSLAIWTLPPLRATRTTYAVYRAEQAA